MLSYYISVLAASRTELKSASPDIRGNAVAPALGRPGANRGRCPGPGPPHVPSPLPLPRQPFAVLFCLLPQTGALYVQRA